jgi:membrane protease subunit HflC
MKAGKIVAGILVLVGVVAFLSIIIVKEVNQAIILQFGDPKRIIMKPGLNFKIPFIQNVVYLDKRILNLDTPPEEVIASDQKRLIVDAFARFQIVDPLKFYISVGDERVARSRLSTIINSRIRNVLGQEELQTLLSKDRSKQMELIKEGVNNEAQNFGISIVDVRIKRADLPQANSDAIYRRMQTEREREAKEFRAQGAEMAVTITSTADKEVTVILADAQKQSEIMKGEGDGTRNKIFADAFGQDPEFFAFYRAMQAYEKALIGGETSLILSPDSEFFKFFGNELVIAFGLFLFIEGILYALFPSKMKSMLKKLDLLKDSQLRSGGLVFAVIGFVIIYFVKS